MSGRVAVVDLPGQRRLPREELSMFRRFIVEEDAQELMEYLYLCAFVALLGVLVWNNIVTLSGQRLHGLQFGHAGTLDRA